MVTVKRRLVIDSNMIQSQFLRDYLAVSTANLAVLPDMFWIETYKQESIPAVAAALSVIGSFPDQIVVLKSSGEIVAIGPLSNVMGAIPSKGASTDLREIVHAIELAKNGEQGVIAQLMRQWSRATDHMDGMLEGAADILESLPEMAAMFTADELRKVRTTNTLTMSMKEKIFGAADQICETLFREYGREAPTDRHQRADTYLYRYSLAILMYLIWWIRNGSQLPRRHDKARNDFIDLSFAVYGSYFDGLMTEDTKATWMHAQLCSALKAIRSIR
ncbi:hypothetical protein [Rhizobium rhizogenes]|uniref:hypothetical protein n=1 Tax=Rhizobium rhizogenes TaxID=359 RepID=UPI001574898D|nr:hypothetical protein [Rhizobium rhizogenes]NTI33411.1 hypothetical protein [Rhizobium rhizogenes]WEO65110.1 hypothetical protein G6L54_019085 [Rhizobium rhizogenes]